MPLPPATLLHMTKSKREEFVRAQEVLGRDELREEADGRDKRFSGNIIKIHPYSIAVLTVNRMNFSTHVSKGLFTWRWGIPGKVRYPALEG